MMSLGIGSSHILKSLGLKNKYLYQKNTIDSYSDLYGVYFCKPLGIIL